MPDRKLERGYRTVADTFAEAGVTRVPSDLVAPPRVAECPIQMEATLAGTTAIGPGGAHRALEVCVDRVHAEERLLAAPDRIDPAAWRPLIMSFQRFWGLSEEEAASSRLAEIPEALYR